MKTYHIDCELDYEVDKQSLFVFNLGVPSTPGQRVMAETVSTTRARLLNELRYESGRLAISWSASWIARSKIASAHRCRSRPNHASTRSSDS